MCLSVGFYWYSRWWFQFVYHFYPYPWEDDSQFDEHMFDSWVETQPTTEVFGGCLWPVPVQ